MSLTSVHGAGMTTPICRQTVELWNVVRGQHCGLTLGQHRLTLARRSHTVFLNNFLFKANTLTVRNNVNHR